METAFWSGEQLPFSFLYGGRHSSAFLHEWRFWESAESAEGGSIRLMNWRDPQTALRVCARVRSFAQVGGTEWVFTFSDEGAADTPMIADILPLDASLPWTKGDRVIIHRTRGSLCHVDDFLPIDDELRPGGCIEYAPVGGRSSDGIMPFMNIELGKPFGPQAHGGFRMPDASPSGFMLAIGWSGQWKAGFRRTDDALQVSAGMERTALRLHPGESIRTPRILVVPWNGRDEQEGYNRLRRLILDHYTPKNGSGEPIMPPIAHMRQLVYYFTGQATEEDHLLAAERAHELGIEALWVDALWYGGGSGPGVDWASQVGTWKVRADRFPRGLKPIADAAHKRGMKFVLWFEPERVFVGTEIQREHPDYLLRKPGEERTFLLDLGNPAARRHVMDLVSGMIASAGIDIYQQDFNMEPLPYWREADEPDRVGMHEIRHIEGLYAFWDELRSRHPGLAIDNCASGGRRIDLETTARSFPLWRSDYTDVVALHEGYSLQIGAQCQVSGLSRWVPLHTGAVWTFAPYDFRSSMAAGVIPYMDIRAADYPAEAAMAAFGELKRLRPYWRGDFWSIVPLTVAAHDWAAYQCDRQDLDAGFAVFLRRHESPYPTCHAVLRGIDEAATYEARMSPTFEQVPPVLLAGADLARLQVSIADRPGSLLVEYRRVEVTGA
ncbi:MAG: glycoside hydrolase family 36 protein [Candidatus Latescibacterota bacterium]